MRVLLDEQLPRQLVPYFVGHDTRTVQEEGWAGLKNGDLLKQAEVAGFEIFVTSDQNLEFQQNLKRSRLFVVILSALSNAIEDLLPLRPRGTEESKVSCIHETSLKEIAIVFRAGCANTVSGLEAICCRTGLRRHERPQM